ncbi:DDE_3 domain-containing protein [Trichonephila clavipes]|nr:DDE_3 domain-containing protein [Trichonephila clavipes]
MNEVVFTDESRICLQHHDGQIRVWRHSGERMLNCCVMHHHTGPAPGIMTSPGLSCSLILAGLSYGERQVPVTIKRTPLNGTVSVVQNCIFWGADIVLGSRADLHIQITMTGQIYQGVILEKHAHLYQSAMGGELVFRDDNAHHHRANIVSECLQSEDIRT